MITKDINIMICDGNMLRNEKLEFRFNTGSGVALLRSKEKVSIVMMIMLVFNVDNEGSSVKC